MAHVYRESYTKPMPLEPRRGDIHGLSVLTACPRLAPLLPPFLTDPPNLPNLIPQSSTSSQPLSLPHLRPPARIRQFPA